MKIITSQPQLNNLQAKQNISKQQPAFKGLINNGFKFLADEPVWGATIIDVGAMVLPRTWTDMKKRGINAGFETGFRESESSANNAFIGMYGVGASALIAGGINKAYDIKANKIFASDDAIQVFTSKWNQHKGNISSYVEDIVDNIEAYNPNSKICNEKGMVKIPQEHKKGIIEDLKFVAEGDRKSMPERFKQVADKLSVKMISALGVEEGVELLHNEAGVKKSTISNTKTLIENFSSLTKALKSDKVAGKTGELLKDYKKFAKGRTILGMGIAALLAVGAQPLNIYLTKKRTGSDGFVGVEGRSKDTSASFKTKKLLSTLGMIAITLGTLGAIPKNPKNLKQIPKLFMEKNQYKGKNPTINQFKTIFGFAISSRLLTARDKDEHREVVTKDVLGYFNWLILGNIFNKAILHKFQNKDLKLLKRKPLPNDASMFKRVKNFLGAEIATHTEVIQKGLKKELGISSLIKADGTAMKFKEMYNKLPKNGATKKSLRILNIAQFGGYIYSGVVLGWGIPNLNIHITNMKEKKKKAMLEKANLQQQIQPTLDKSHVDKMINKTAFGQFHHAS